MINHFGKYHLKIFRWMIKKYFVIFWKISTLLFSCGGAAGYNGPGEGSERRRRGFLLFSFNLHFPPITFNHPICFQCQTVES